MRTGANNMSITIRQPGILTMIQDLGRYGEQKYGVIVGVAMDPISLRIANILVGNEQSEGGLEIVLFGLSFQFNEDTLIAITGGQLHPTIDGKPAPMWRPRSEEHTSELQSRFDLVCRLLLEKKKKDRKVIVLRL